MKKYMFCFLLFIAAAVMSAVLLYAVSRYRVRQEPAVPNTVIETETVNDLDSRAAAAVQIPEETKEEKSYCLVSEAGFLLVLDKDKSTICLYTHIPITDFPVQEQDRLREGIWFSRLQDVYSYLESYTS